MVRGRQRSGSRNAVFRAFVALLLGVLILAVAGVGTAFAGGIAAWTFVNRDLPPADQAQGLQFATTKIYDRHGTLLNEVSDPQNGWRTPVSYQEIKNHISQQQAEPNKPHRAWIIDATVAAEDSSFWNNPGVNPLAIARSAFVMVRGGATTGASTITQQLVRRLYPDQVGTDRTITRKIREAIVALQFTRQHSKTEILDMYLNDIYYGARSYGIDAASQTYFNLHPWDLTLGQAAMLAGLPQSPSLYDPTQNYELAKQRQRYVLNQMVEQRMITAQQADDAYAEPLNLQDGNGSRGVNLAPHFVNYVKDYLERKFGAEAVYRGGLTVRTTLDYHLQDVAQQAVTRGVNNFASSDVNNGALVAMLPGTGEIVAMVGSADYYNNVIDGQVNVATSERQPGSSIKPITYLAAFEKGWNPDTKILDAPTRFPLPGQPGKYYMPHNYTGKNYGVVTARTALANSLNIPAVKTIDYVGVPQMIDLAHKMGIKTGLWRGTSFYGLAVTLGGGEVTLLEHTNAFATLANRGRYVPYTPLLQVTDSSGKTLLNLDREHAYDKGQQVADPGKVAWITSILSDNNARSMLFGSHSPLILQPELNIPVAAKTGTTEDARDLWTMGYTPDLTVGVWTGNTDNHPTGWGSLDGVQVAAPIWHEVMVKAHTDPEILKTLVGPDGKPIPPDFPAPPPIPKNPTGRVAEANPVIRNQDSSSATEESAPAAGNSPTPEENAAPVAQNPAPAAQTPAPAAAKQPAPVANPTPAAQSPAPATQSPSSRGDPFSNPNFPFPN